MASFSFPQVPAVFCAAPTGGLPPPWTSTNKRPRCVHGRRLLGEVREGESPPGDAAQETCER
eukprot:13473744-Alexandrium_andersonii.AAC.1